MIVNEPRSLAFEHGDTVHVRSATAFVSNGYMDNRTLATTCLLPRVRQRIRQDQCLQLLDLRESMRRPPVLRQRRRALMIWWRCCKERTRPATLIMRSRNSVLCRRATPP